VETLTDIAVMRPRAGRLAAVIALVASASVAAQDQEEPTTARETAPVDLTGYWTSVITEDWRWRMVTPPKGDYASLPLTDEARRTADAWDPETDGSSCKAYGAAGVMRMPLRVHITWEDDNTLRIDTDHGEQTRLLHFDGEAVFKERSLQGYSRASWGGDDVGIDRPARGQENRGTTLRVVTTQLLPGYLRRNGVPYGEETVVTEYFDRHSDYGEDWFTVTTIVNDPVHLTQEFITSSSFKRLPDGSSWNPVACDSD
jgi:hypothetical protein